MKTENTWKTSDISIWKDSIGFYYAEHKYQGLLLETEYFPDRNAARREAVVALNEKKNQY